MELSIYYTRLIVLELSLGKHEAKVLYFVFMEFIEIQR